MSPPNFGVENRGRWVRIHFAHGGFQRRLDKRSMPNLASGAEVQQSLELTYSRARNDVSYSVESSDDLITWNAAPVNQGGAGSPVTATVPLGNAGQRYLRVKIETAP